MFTNYETLKDDNDVETINDINSNEIREDNFIYLTDTELLIYNAQKTTVNKAKYRNVYCVNCGEKGHVVKDCEGPITSFGIIAFKLTNKVEDEIYDKNKKLQKIVENIMMDSEFYIRPHKSEYPKIKFLMIQRKDTMGYTDFVRGKYPENNEETAKILQTCLNEMTIQEKNTLLTKSFDEIWSNLWINHDSKCYKNEYENAHNKYKKLDIKHLVSQSDNRFEFQEFGFPKGRRNMKETNIACAEREFLEETGYDKSHYDFIKNYPTIHEEFTGTNGVQYRHIYYLVKMKENAPPPHIDYQNKVQTGEVQNIGWFSYEECMTIMRPYDKAKKKVVKKVNQDLLDMNDNYICSNFYYTSRNQFRSPNKFYNKDNFKNFYPKSL
jgi:8-oxo-dGTP pyrophosphatase MutT (NUDIX family)